MKALLFATLTLGGALIQPVWAADAVTFKEKVLHSFVGSTDGANPTADLIDVNGMLYGTTAAGGGTGCGGEGCGTVFSIEPNAGAETVLYSFQGNADGAFPVGGLVAVNGILYGTTYQGGAGLTDCGGIYGCGTVFSLNVSTGKKKVLYSFCNRQNCPDGAEPSASLIEVNGKLYGTTERGGVFDDGETFGTVFAVDSKTGAETVVYAFCSQNNCTDGGLPSSALIFIKGSLYGTTFGGGGGGGSGGTAFAVDPKTSAETVLYSFGSQANGTDGLFPEAGLVRVKGTLYGTTAAGGTHYPCVNGNPGCGTVFSIDRNTGVEKVLYSFSCQQNCTDGWDPSADLIVVKGVLYGTTEGGGGTGCNGYGCGTVFSVDRSTGAEQVIYSFCRQQNCTDGEGPNAGLVAVNGKLYGTTEDGGIGGCDGHGCGTVFVLKKKR